jgi:hypothetical protein
LPFFIAGLSPAEVNSSVSHSTLSEVMGSCRSRGATDDFRLERNDPVRDNSHFFPDQKMVAVYERNDCVGCFLYAFNQVGIEVKFTFIEPGKLYHDTLLPK